MSQEENDRELDRIISNLEKKFDSIDARRGYQIHEFDQFWMSLSAPTCLVQEREEWAYVWELAYRSSDTHDQ